MKIKVRIKFWHLILLGLFMLFYFGMAQVAGVLILIGITMLFEHFWPEKWDAEEKKKEKVEMKP